MATKNEEAEQQGEGARAEEVRAQASQNAAPTRQAHKAESAGHHAGSTAATVAVSHKATPAHESEASREDDEQDLEGRPREGHDGGARSGLVPLPGPATGPAAGPVGIDKEAKAERATPPPQAKAKENKTRNNVRKIRMERMMSKAELARRAAVSTLTIDRVERGLPCRMDTKRKILEALGLNPADRVLVFGEDD